MTMFDVIFVPLVPLGVLIGLALVGGMATGLAWWQGLSGWWLRGMAYAVVIAMLANPMIRDTKSADLEDIAVVIVDRTSSNRLGIDLNRSNRPWMTCWPDWAPAKACVCVKSRWTMVLTTQARASRRR